MVEGEMNEVSEGEMIEVSIKVAMKLSSMCSTS